MDDPWEKAYVYGRLAYRGTVAHIVVWPDGILCIPVYPSFQNHTPKPYPICKNCLRTKRAKELGL